MALWDKKTRFATDLLTGKLDDRNFLQRIRDGINETPLAQGIERFGQRQIKPLIRGIDADNATTREIEGLAFAPGNIRGIDSKEGVRSDKHETHIPQYEEPRGGTIPEGQKYLKQSLVTNDQTNLLGRLLVSDVNDEVANKLINDTAFTQALGTTPAELNATRTQLNDAIDAGLRIQGDFDIELVKQGHLAQRQGVSTPEGKLLLSLRDKARKEPTNQNVSLLLDAVRNPVVRVMESAERKPVQPFREVKSPQSFSDYNKLKAQQEKRLRKALRRDGMAPEDINQYIQDNPNPNLPDLDEDTFNQIRLEVGDDAFNVGMEFQPKREPKYDARADEIEDVFLADYLKGKLYVSPEAIDLAAASRNTQTDLNSRVNQSIILREGELEFDPVYNDPRAAAKLDAAEDRGKSLREMRDAVIKVEEIGGNATDILRADELRRSKAELEAMKGRSLTPRGAADPEVAGYASRLIDLEDLQASADKEPTREIRELQQTVRDKSAELGADNPEVTDLVTRLIDLEDLQAAADKETRLKVRRQLEQAVSDKSAELDRTRPDVIEAGLQFIANQEAQPRGGGRKTAAKVLGAADRAGMNTPFLSKAGADTYNFFINPKNPLNLGTPVLLAGSAALAGTGALVADAVYESELEKYNNSMASGYASSALRKASPEALAYAIANSEQY